MRPQKIVKRQADKQAVVINEKHQAILDGKSQTDKPVRAIYYVDISRLSQSQINTLYQQISANLSNSLGGQHYVVPVRDNKLACDVIFEKEILDIVNDICEVKDGQIAMKNGYQDIVVIRKHV